MARRDAAAVNATLLLPGIDAVHQTTKSKLQSTSLQFLTIANLYPSPPNGFRENTSRTWIATNAILI